MDLNTLWFILIGVLFSGFFLLEGFDFGVGILLPFLAKDDTERRVMLNTIGPFWDGNEVWLLVAGGAMFAAFPNWYATLFSGFYLALFLLLLALIVRGVAFEFRGKDARPGWRSFWDMMIFLGSFLPALLIGVAFANLARGVAIDAKMQYVGTFFDLLNPYALLGGLASVSAFAFYGALFLHLKTTDDLSERARQMARGLWHFAAFVLALYLVATFGETDVLVKAGYIPDLLPIGVLVSIAAAGWLLNRGRAGWAFVMTAVTILLYVVNIFAILFPRVMISRLNADWSLTIYNASSSPYTLSIITTVAVIFVPIVLAYQAWTYWIFRKRVTAKPESLTY